MSANLGAKTMNLPSSLGRLGTAHAARKIARVGVIGLAIAGSIHSQTSNSQQAVRGASQPENQAMGHSPRLSIDLPIVTPVVSVDPTSERAVSTTTGVDAREKQTAPLQSARANLKEAQVAVSLSQAQLAQARINLSEFQAQHDTTKILSQQGKVSRQAAATAQAAYKLAQLQHRSASIGLQESQAQLVAAKAEVSKLGCKANPVTRI
jgi:hypothetical protein